MTAQISITLPDGSAREYPAGTTAVEVAASIGKRLAKAAVAAAVDGNEVDLGGRCTTATASPSSPTTPRPGATCCATRRPT